MIKSIEGLIISLEEKIAIINIGGFGLAINISPQLKTEMTVGKSFKLDCHLVVRENSLELFGFKNKAELNFFEMLISVSGIGPRGAMNILSQVDYKTLKKAIIQNNIDYLTSISGLGKKTSTKLILELKDKIEIEGSEDGLLADDQQVIEALRSLGFSLSEAKKGLEKISNQELSVEEKIKLTLKTLSKK